MKKLIAMALVTAVMVVGTAGSAFAKQGPGNSGNNTKCKGTSTGSCH